MADNNVELIIRLRAEGQAALGSLRQAVGGLSQESKTATASVSNLEQVELKLSGTIKLVTAATEAQNQAQQKSVEVTNQSVLKAILLNETLQRVAGAMKAATIDAALYASRTEQLNTVMDQLARANGLSVTAVRAQANALRDLGITTQESRNTINQMIFAQLDLTRVTELGRLSQNAAKIAGISSSEALAGIINGIKTQQIEVLRTYGIQVSFEQALARGAAQLGKTRETLTDYERANIALQEVLSKFPRISGAYEVSLTTTAGQMQSLSRLTDEAKNAIGERFAPALQRSIEFLTAAAKAAQEHADALSNIGAAAGAAAIAYGAFRLTPGPPVVKGIAALVAGGGAAALTNADPSEAAIDSARAAIAKIDSEKQLLKAKVEKGIIKDKEQYVTELKRLSDLEVVVEEELADKLARVYEKKRKALEESKANSASNMGRLGLALALTPFTGFSPDLNNVPAPGRVDLSPSRSLSPERIEAARKRIGQDGTDLAGLKFTPDKQSEIDSQLAKFMAQLKEAQKSAQSSLDRARISELGGVDKVQAERGSAFEKVNREFQPFDESLRKGKDFQRLLGTIGKEYDILLDKQKRTDQVEALQWSKKIADTQAQIAVDQLKQKNQQAQDLANASVEKGSEEANIRQVYKLRLELAQQEYEAAVQRNAADLQAAQQIFQLNRQKKALTEAENADRIAGLKASAALTKELTDAEHDAQVAILKLRKEQRKELESAYANAQRIVQAEQNIELSRAKDAASRSIRRAQANTLPGDERYAQELQLRTRVSTAQQEYEMVMEGLEAQRKASIEAYARTKDKAELERVATEIATKQLQANYNLEKELLDARLDREVQIAEIRKQQTAELRQSLGQLYDAARASGKVGIQEFFKGYIEQIKKTLFVNLGEELFRGTTQKLGGIIPGQEKIDPVTGKGTGELTTLGRILRGTPLGIDPAKLAADRQLRAQDRNTTALDRLTDTLNGRSAGPLPAGSSGVGGGLGKVLGTIFGGGANTGMIIKNFSGDGRIGSGFDFQPDQGLGGFLAKVTSFVRPKVDASGKPTFSAGQTALAAAAAVPSILEGIREGGLRGTLGAASGALGAVASIPGPQQPFLLAGAVVAGLLGGLVKSERQKKAERLAERLSQRFSLPNSIDTVSDLAGNAVDFDSRGDLRTYRQQQAPSITVNVSAMDAKSFFDRGPELADSVMNMLQLGHPLRSEVGSIAGVA